MQMDGEGQAAVVMLLEVEILLLWVGGRVVEEMELAFGQYVEVTALLDGVENVLGCFCALGLRLKQCLTVFVVRSLTMVRWILWIGFFRNGVN